MRQASPVSSARAGSNTGAKFFVAFIWKIMLVREIKMKSNYKRISSGLQKT